MSAVKTKLRIKPLDQDLKVPRFAKPGDVAFDLRSSVDITIAPGKFIGVPQ